MKVKFKDWFKAKNSLNLNLIFNKNNNTTFHIKKNHK